MRELEKRKQLLLEKKRGSDSTQGSYNTPSKKSMESLLSPPLSKKVLRLQEYEEGGDTIKVGGDTTRENRVPSSAHYSRTEEGGERRGKEAERRGKEADHRGSDKLNEMERRLKERLEVELSLSTSRQESGSMFSHGWSKGLPSPAMGTSPMHSSDNTRSPSLNSWRNSTSPSDVRPGGGHGTFGYCPLPTTTTTALAGGAGGSGHHPHPSASTGNGSGFHDARKVISHSDSSEWTEFACASTSSGSVEVGGQIGTVSTHSSSTPIRSLSDFDPISTNSSTDPSKPP